MAEEIASLNIYQKLARIRKRVEVMRKDSKGYGYTYTNEEAILAKITGALEKYHLSLIPGVVPGSTRVTPYTYYKTKFTQDGEKYDETANEILVSADMTWTWVNDDDPAENIVVPWTMVGQQSDASQSFGSGLTYSSRYFLLKYFNVSTTKDDPDNWRSKQRAADAEEERLVAEGIVSQIHTGILTYIADHPEKKDEVREFCKRYAKEGKYQTIKDPAVAGKMLDDFQNTYMN